MAWKQGRTGAGDESVEAAGLGGGLQEGTGNHGRLGVGGGREITLGGSCDGTLGRPGIGVQGGWQDGGARLRDTCGRCCPCEGSGNNLKAIDDLILCGRCRDGKLTMAQFDCIGDNLAFGVRADKFEAAA